MAVRESLRENIQIERERSHVRDRQEENKIE